MNSVQNTPWEQNAPYTKMLLHYERAVRRLKQRREDLKAELHTLRSSKQGTLASARAQTLLEKRIELLYEEYTDLTDAMREIRIYAAKEVH